VVLAFYRGPGLLGVEMPVSNGRRFTADAIDGRGGVNGDSRGGIKAGEKGALIGISMMEAGRCRAINCGEARWRRDSGRPARGRGWI
jgi:hypothetical protein